MKYIFKKYVKIHFFNLMLLYKLNFYKNSTGQLSNLANPSEHSWQSSPRSSELFQASRYRQFLHIAFMVVARQNRGYLLRSEHQTLRRSLNFSQCHFCIYQSAIRDEIEREKLVDIYTECIVN